MALINGNSKLNRVGSLRHGRRRGRPPVTGMGPQQGRFREVGLQRCCAKYGIRSFADLLLNSRAQDFAQAKKSALTDDLANRGAFTAQRIGSIRNLLNVMQVQNTDASNARSAGGFSLPTQMAVITSA